MKLMNGVIGGILGGSSLVGASWGGYEVINKKANSKEREKRDSDSREEKEFKWEKQRYKYLLEVATHNTCIQKGVSPWDDETWWKKSTPCYFWSNTRDSRKRFLEESEIGLRGSWEEISAYLASKGYWKDQGEGKYKATIVGGGWSKKVKKQWERDTFVFCKETHPLRDGKVEVICKEFKEDEQERGWYWFIWTV
ncbi:hypothetical protein MSUIS_04750 [Mycoplasma suis KI3806]|uniref:Uncharacterized protein n=1 Tax=Mycoplasma suis (strain KI_3806) TaxID=708248 RepID=F0V1N7_MYCS3|nr:hypothetical protein [Mycoplasma suis]CBZ40568.1 hypothetical protein MSUIS_04750 [Mycoplasma suis KI3806]